MFFGSISFYISEKFKIPRIPLLLIFGFLSGLTGILPREWFDPFGSGEFPLRTIVELILVIVLFFGGYSIDIPKIKKILRPGILLATIGVFIVSMIVASVIRLAFPSVFGIITALIIGSLIAPNDPIAVTSTQHTFKLHPDVNAISKFESGFDDTMVTTLIILILIPISQNITSGDEIQVSTIILQSIFSFIWLTFSAVLIGLVLGYSFSFVYNKIQNKDVRLVVNVILPFLSYVIASIEISPQNPISSGYIAVFVSGLVFGRNMIKNKPEYSSIYKIWDYIFFFCEIFCFIILGTLVELDEFNSVFLPSILIVAVIIFVTRPLEISLCTLKTDLKLKDKIFIGFIGLKGLDPAVLAIAAYESLVIIENPHAFINGVELLIPLTFMVIFIITIAQSVILTLLFGKNGYYSRKSRTE